MEAARPAVADDLATLLSMHRRAIAEQVGGRGGRIWAGKNVMARPEAELIDAIADADQLVLVGTIDTVPVGYALCRIDSLHDGTPLGVLAELYVDAEGRGVGVGECLVDEVLAWCRTKSCVGVDALALPGNRDTKNFFETFGFAARALVVHRSLVEEA